MGVLTGVLLLLLGAAPVITSDGTPVVEVLTNTTGTIQAPPDPTGDKWYLPNARHLWILDMQRSDVNIEVTVEEVDLGLPYTAIHEEGTMRNYTAGDFILIGAGSDLLMGNELMFYGTRQASKKVVVRSGKGHVFFYSNPNVTESTGFTITYTIADMASTVPPLTTPATTPPPLSRAVVPIKGIPVDKWFSYNDTFKTAISDMASGYAHEALNMTEVNVSPSEVVINRVMTCNPDYCPTDMCVAYDFSLATVSGTEAVFGKGDLDDMLADPSANEYIREAFGGDCQICDEDPDISILLYVAIPIGFVFVGVIVTAAAWKLTGRSTFSHAQEKYEQAQRERMDDQRRRSSGDVSILGFGGRSIASRGSRSSRRFTMPFPKAGRDEVDQGTGEGEQEEEVDTSDFIYYDPDQGMTDPAQFGLGGVVSELTRQGQGSHHYTNEAFVMDEETAAAFQRSSFADDDSDTDSDNGGALSFRPRKREMTQHNVPADVHHPDVEADTAL